MGGFLHTFVGLGWGLNTYTSCRAETGDHKNMPNTGERREITARANAKEVETVQEAQKLVAKTKQLSASKNAKSLGRSARALKGQSRERTT